MENVLEGLPLDLAAYRTSVDWILSEPLATPSELRKCFLNILVSTSRLYLDYQLFRKRLPELWEASTKRKANPPDIQFDRPREMQHRARLREKLECLTCWRYFTPSGAFADLTGLRTLTDFIDQFSLHLPEIYEETLRVEVYIERFLDNGSGSALADLEVGMQHLGRNHAGFVLQALEWASDESSWSEP